MEIDFKNFINEGSCGRKKAKKETKAKNEKKERRRAAEVEKMARRYARANEGARMLTLMGYLPGKNDSKAVRERKEAMRRDIMKRAEEFMAKERLKKEREMAKEGQISLFE